jgi:hypothetical protein
MDNMRRGGVLVTNFRNAAREKTSALLHFLSMFLAKHLSHLAFTRLVMQTLGERANYVQWVIDTFSKKPDLVLSREKVWNKLISEVARDRPVVVWEFGVAWGYSTDWWLKRLPQEDLNWLGFDRFIGLPRDWRNYRAGDLSTGGVPPAINDPRVRWYVGDVEDTLPKVDIRRDPIAQWVILFDLDIYEPTSFVWKHLQQYLRPGDLLYFDEAFDGDERRVLNESVVRNPEIQVSLFACSPLALALQVESVKQS